MALAPFFDKAALAASTVLQGFDRESFATLLDSQVVEIAYDANAASSREGRVALELTTNLLARLYPRIRFTAIEHAGENIARDLAALARSINPHIDIMNDDADRAVSVSVVVGRTELRRGSAPIIYAGSDGWIMRVSSEAVVGCGDSDNPFGAATAACFAAANVFRVVFGAQLQSAAVDRDVTMSLLDLDPMNEAPPNPAIGSVVIEGAQLVGAGAIGCGFLWSLARARTITGTLDVIDGETLDATNPQRYVLARSSDFGVTKTQLAVREFEDNESAVTVRPHSTTWGRYITMRGPGSPLHTVAVAVDSARDRIAVQAALPRQVFNAWTQTGDLGVSRHRFGAGACLACLYMRDTAAKNEDQLVAEAIGLPNHVVPVRELLHSGRPVGAELIQVIANALGIGSQPLMPFADRPLRSFYSEAVCGGMLIRLGAAGASTEVPLAFQSALAGVLLASAVVGDAAGLQSPRGTTAVIDLLRPLGSYLSVPVAPHPSGHCICQDADYLARYAELHPSSVAHVKGRRNAAEDRPLASVTPAPGE